MHYFHHLIIKKSLYFGFDLTMHTSLLERQLMQDKASFSKLTRRARRMARTTKKQSKIKNDFAEKDFKKLTCETRQMAIQASPAPSTRQQSFPAPRAEQGVASSTNAPNFCLGKTVAMTCGIANYSWPVQTSSSTNHPAQYGVTSPLIDSQTAVPVMICPVQVEPQSMSAQLHGQNFHPCSSLLLSAFAMGAAWATRPVPHFASSGISGLPLGML